MVNGDTYDGVSSNTSKPEVTLLTVFIQAWREDKACGYGVKTFSCRDHHEGQYWNDRRHGFGVYRWGNGDVYTGMWKDGKMEGHGTKRMADGSVYDGVRCLAAQHIIESELG